MNHKDPIEHFQAWYNDAVSKKVAEVDTMVLATASRDGQPSARVVLLKGIDQGEIVFFTNYESRKGQDLLENPRAALVFYWHTLVRQIRVEGTVERLTSRLSDEYWRSRPRESQLSGFVSEQSRVIPSFDFLTHSVRKARDQFTDQEIPRPEHWGGYRLVPSAFEFWAGRENRLHHRTRYQLTAEGWVIDLLSP